MRRTLSVFDGRFKVEGGARRDFFKGRRALSTVCELFYVLHIYIYIYAAYFTLQVEPFS